MPVPKNLLLSISCQCIMTDSSNPLTQSCLFLKTKFESVECVSNLREITLKRLLDWSDADDLSRRRESKSLNVSLCATACVRSYRVMEAADWWNHEWHQSGSETRALLTDNSRAEWRCTVGVMQSWVCRSGIKWVEHAAHTWSSSEERVGRAAKKKQTTTQNSLHVYSQFTWPTLFRGSAVVFYDEMKWNNHSTACSLMWFLSFCAECNNTRR